MFSGKKKKRDAKEQKINEMYLKEIESVLEFEKSSDEIINLLYAQHVKGMEKMKAVYLAVLEKISRIIETINIHVGSFTDVHEKSKLNLSALKAAKDKVIEKISNTGRLMFDMPDEKHLMDEKIVTEHLEKVRKEALLRFEQIFNKIVDERLDKIVNDAKKEYETIFRGLTGDKSEFSDNRVNLRIRLRISNLEFNALSEIREFIGDADKDLNQRESRKIRKLNTDSQRQLDEFLERSKKIWNLGREAIRKMRTFDGFDAGFSEIINTLKRLISETSIFNINEIIKGENRPRWNQLIVQIESLAATR